MIIDTSLPFLSNYIIKQGIFLARPAVERQLLAIALAILLGWLLAKELWLQIKRQFPKATDIVLTYAKMSLNQCGITLLENLLPPIKSLMILYLFRIFFIWQNWTNGLLTVALTLLWFYLAYQIFLAILYGNFSAIEVNKYRIRLFTPLFILFILIQLISLTGTDLQQLQQASPFKLFGQAITLKDIFVLTIGFYLWVITVTLIEQIILHLFSGETRLSSATVQTSSLLFRYFLIGLGIVWIFGYVGVNATALAAITGGLSVGLGFGLQQVVSNFLSGILLIFEGVLKPGDIISVGGVTSRVEKLGIRATRVRVTSDNSEKIIPNQTFFTSEVTTYTGSDRLVYRSIEVSASYNNNPEEVIAVLLTIAQQHPQVLKEPPPTARLINFGDSSINFQLKFALDDPTIGGIVSSELGCIIWKVFADNNIEMPFPQRDIHIRTDNSEITTQFLTDNS